MRSVITIISIMLVATSALANKQVSIGSDGLVVGISSIYGKGAKVNHNKNQYSDAEWAAFGITEEAPYIVKDGAIWRDMVQAEKDAVDTQLKQETLDEANSDVDMDALFNALATLLNKPRQDVEDAFKAGVDPKKAEKQKKEK